MPSHKKSVPRGSKKEVVSPFGDEKDLPPLLRKLLREGEKFGLKAEPLPMQLRGSIDRDLNNESWLDLNYNPGSPEKGVPWEEFSELEIQTILKIFFEEQGYAVIWRHVIDPANEAGIDLECRRKSDGDVVLVAVKKNPKKDALAQLVELKSQEASKRIYAYVGGAAQSFRDQAPSFEDSIEVWDERILEEQLNLTGMTLRLKVDNSTANRAIFEITGQIVRAIRERPGFDHDAESKVLEETRSDMMEKLWAMKDRAVTINQSFKMAQHLFETEDNLTELSDAQVQKLVLFVLGFIYAYGLRSIGHAFTKPTRELTSLLYIVHEKTELRSNWTMLYSYRPGLIPGQVDRSHRDFEEERAKLKGLMDFDDFAEKRLRDTRGMNIKYAATICRSYSVWAYGLEATIDDLFTKCLRGDVRS